MRANKRIIAAVWLGVLYTAAVATISEEVADIASMPWTPLSLVALLIVGVCFLYHTKFTKLGVENKELAAKQMEVVRLETEKRKMARDQELAVMKNEYRTVASQLGIRIDEVNRTAVGTGNSFDKHISDHKERDAEIKEKDGRVAATLEDLKARMARAEHNSIPRSEFAEMDKTMTKILIMMEHKIKKTGVENEQY